jgi:UDP-glucose 4-epimerase
LQRSLVTGGAGFIGSNLVDALLERGDQVLVVDDLSTGSRANLADALAGGRVALREGDVAAVATMAAVTDFRPEAVFHLAAQADVRKAIADPAHDATVNVLGTIRALELARESGARLVFSSTGGASYGEGEQRRLPFEEGDPTLPETAYGVSKLAGEGYVSLYRRLHGLAAVSLRLGNVFGPRQDPHGEAGVVAIFCGRLLAGAPPLVFGDGRQTRDYVFVGDVVAGLLAAERALAEGRQPSAVLNLGTGIETSVLELVRILSRVAGVSAEPELRPHREGEIERVAISPRAAERELGWRPREELEAALAKTFEWARRGGPDAGRERLRDP